MPQKAIILALFLLLFPVLLKISFFLLILIAIIFMIVTIMFYFSHLKFKNELGKILRNQDNDEIIIDVEAKKYNQSNNTNETIIDVDSVKKE
ncbi:MAG: hypothetical protein J5803_04315 [Desulfovibrio sp.]|nr:hypothetical protein [Desulfovibrio sp.]